MSVGVSGSAAGSVCLSVFLCVCHLVFARIIYMEINRLLSGYFGM